MQVIFFLLSFGAAITTWACPPACLAYDNYMVIVASGPNKEEVLKKGKAAALKLKSDFPGEENAFAPSECVNKGNCVAFLESNSNNFAWVDQSLQSKYAAAYLIAEYKESKSKAQKMLKKVKVFVSDAYVKPVHACACE